LSFEFDSSFCCFLIKSLLEVDNMIFSCANQP
jgi:hypothetical protein